MVKVSAVREKTARKRVMCEKVKSIESLMRRRKQVGSAKLFNELGWRGVDESVASAT